MNRMDPCLNQRIHINVSGSKFQTTYEVLERFPGTRLAILASLRRDDEAFDVETNEFYFDRNPEVFADILQYYRTQELHLRSNLCGNVVQKEFEFWGMFEQDIEPCCWTTYSKAQECKETLAAIDSTFLTGQQQQEEESPVIEKDLSSWLSFRRKMWCFLEDPSTSMVARPYVIGHRVYVFVSMFVVIVSILCFVLETWEEFRVPINGANMTVIPYCTKACGLYSDPDRAPGKLVYDLDDTVPHPILVYIDYGLFSFFLLELLLRLSFTPSYKVYFKDFLNWIDMTCVLTHAIGIVLNSLENLAVSGYTATLIKTVLILRILRGLRIVRILRIFKLVKHYNAFKILVYTIKISLRELLLMIVFLFVGAVIFGSVIHVVEKESFKNIPFGLWWALVTMTTVGYGDFVPRQTAGFAVGCVCVIFGVLTIAFTVPIVVNNFALYYSHAQSRNKKPKDYWRQKRVPQKAPAAAPRLENVFLKAKSLKLPVKTPAVSNSVLNNLNKFSEKAKEAYRNEKLNTVPNTPDSTDFNDDVAPLTKTVIPMPVNVGPRFFAKRTTSPMPPVEEAQKEEQEKNEEHSRQLLAQIEENEQQMEVQKTKQAAVILKRKMELRKKQNTGGEKTVIQKEQNKQTDNTTIRKNKVGANPSNPSKKNDSNV